MSRVYFLDIRKKYKTDHIKLLQRLIDKSSALKLYSKNSTCAIKLHVGEEGNVHFVNPLYIRCLTNVLKTTGAEPFLTDTTTLYAGRRFRADLHVQVAHEHGFNFAPFIVADGLHGDDFYEIDGAKIAGVFKRVNTIFFVSHFKGHLNCGFGGALKNIGMGCASRGGKLDMHSGAKPYIDRDKCTFCLECYNYCIFNAIKKNKAVTIVDRKCTGCGGCMSICPEKAIKFRWNAASGDLQKKIAEYAAKTIKDKKVFFVNFLTSITPNCDCFHSNEPFIHPDVGILASSDPVSLDQACYDMIKNAVDELHPDLDSQVQLYYAEKFGAGERKYEIESV
ncbi:hypothetical protein A2Y85_00170 [candidate division WOR-3 bacterium RBG_13_43_14]|uniref:4Fe-4S ferredoxin-type domain-containing protein n=1 Tax=candidate division WOR-3 bacterium RBG_13_43_14 TaxID=1802590 RepID=A0A1F4UDB7_UNCW3|nr:MAG: hypothetical protein A2Y85_00170 [candidate division WOR-3 bacterium RBG_13_43_14]